MWTSADGAKTFEGELRRYDQQEGVVEVLSKGRVLTFDQSKLSAQDIQWLGDQQATEKTSAENSTVSTVPAMEDSIAEQEVGKKLLKARLQRFEKRRYKKAELEKVPEYYLLYYAASW